MRLDQTQVVYMMNDIINSKINVTGYFEGGQYGP